MKKILWISNIVTFGLLIFIALHYHVPQKVIDKVLKKTTIHKEHKDSTQIDCTYDLKYFDFHYKKECNSPKIIMLGNSLIRHGNWSNLLNRNDVINRGISGDCLPCMCERLKYLKGLNAKIWFVEGGINDLPSRTPSTLFENYKSIIDFVKSENAIPVINLVVYLSPKAGKTYPSRIEYKKINSMISELNTMLIEYAKSNNIEYIDLNSIVADKNDVLKDEFTTDGVHLTEKVYDKWSKMICYILKKNKI